MSVSKARAALIPGRSRAGQSLGLAAIILLLGSNNVFNNAVANGDTRTLSFTHTHRDDQITVTFKRNGSYDQDGLKKLNHFLRDWRNDDEIKMDPRLFDVLWEVTQEVGAKHPIAIVSSYRSPATNSMLRRRSRGVAEFSQHTLGKAIDFRVEGVAIEDLRAAGLRQQRGGVGFYPGSNFVHVDVGSVRHWPRMTRDQLAKVFPDGRTVHVPSDGQPLRNYELALADVEKRGSSPSQTEAAAPEKRGKRNFFASLLGRNSKDEDEEGETTASTARTVAPPKPAPIAAPAAVAAVIPLPIARPSAAIAAATAQAPIVVASAAPTATAPTGMLPIQSFFRRKDADNAGTTKTADLSANDVISSRGFWRGVPNTTAEAPPQPAAQPARTAAVAPRPNQTVAQKGTVVPNALPNWPLAKTEKPTETPTETVALSYAALYDPEPVAQASGITATTASLAPVGLTNVVKKTLAPIKATRQQAAARMSMTMQTGTRSLDDPWTRALMLTPDLQNFMSTSLFGAPDYRRLSPLMEKPSSALAMTFSDDPLVGLSTDHFSGTAIVFQSTVTFSNRTALLQR